MRSIKKNLIPAEIRELFVNYDPLETWNKASQIVENIRADIDLSNVKNVFDDVMCLFDGSYPKYSSIQTPYHDLRHTLDVFMCSVRLLHSVHLSGTKLSDEEISLIMIAALLHDVGYAQKTVEARGSGAQLTQIHVMRGIEFMQKNLRNWHLPKAWKIPLTQIIRCTDLRVHLSDIDFVTPRILLLGQIVGSADIVGQMADRTYLEKLLFLFVEFKEAQYGNLNDTHDLLKKTRTFYDSIRKSLDGELGGTYQKLNFHFNEWVGEDRNFYIESIEKNIDYLDKVIKLQKSEWLSMLKRHGIVNRFKISIKKMNYNNLYLQHTAHIS
jgi:hypothetical protein